MRRTSSTQSSNAVSRPPTRYKTFLSYKIKKKHSLFRSDPTFAQVLKAQPEQLVQHAVACLESPNPALAAKRDEIHRSIEDAIEEIVVATKQSSQVRSHRLDQ